MTMQQAYLLRATPIRIAWLKYIAKGNSRSINAEICALIDKAMKAGPLGVFVHHCKLDGDEFFSVSVGKHGDDFHEGANKEQAVQAARAKAKELGIPITCIVFDRVGEHAGEAA